MYSYMDVCKHKLFRNFQLNANKICMCNLHKWIPQSLMLKSVTSEPHELRAKIPLSLYNRVRYVPKYYTLIRVKAYTLIVLLYIIDKCTNYVLNGDNVKHLFLCSFLVIFGLP